jgi:dTDP-4-amino-4,6-dideoxygalactose transaminase
MEVCGRNTVYSRSEAVAKMTLVPFADLGSMARDVWPSVEADYLSYLLGGSYIGGPAVTSFEEQWAAYCETDYAVGVGNGTDALELTLTALGIGPGDEVVVSANAFIAAAAAVVRVGAVPRFADVGDETLLMTPDTLSDALTPRTRAVIVVHMFGQMPDMTGILAVAAKAGIFVIEDGAQAHGAEWDGSRAGTFGDAACFSFYPAKNLGAFGDAGAVVTSRLDLADRVRALANHGRSHGGAHYEHDYVGTNSRLDALQAVLLSGKLRFLEEWTKRRIALAAHYREALSGTGVRLVAVAPAARHVYHLFVVRVAGRDALRAELGRRGIETGVHYPLPCHRQPPLRQFADRPLRVAEQAAGELLSLPMFPHLTESQVEFVCESLGDALGKLTAGTELTYVP